MRARDFSGIACWVLTEGLIGTENQCLGVAGALGVTPKVLRVGLRFPWSVFSPYLGWERAESFVPPLRTESLGAWPDLLIASGRKSIGAARFIRRQSGGACFTVFIQDPRISPRDFDLVAVPEHDPMRGDNVVVTTAAPNRITQAGLAHARAAFDFSFLPQPRVAVLIGGKSKAYRLGKARAEAIARDLKILQNRYGAGLMVTASRRTGAENRRLFAQALAHKDTFFWDGEGQNPYRGFLAWADYILVSADSTSMLSDSASTGVPTYRIDLEGGGERMARLHHTLESCGAVRPFTGTLESWAYSPLRDSAKVAQAIRDRFGTRGVSGF